MSLETADTSEPLRNHRGVIGNDIDAEKQVDRSSAPLDRFKRI